MAELLQSILREGDVIGVDCGTHPDPHRALPDVAYRRATSCS